MSRNLIRSRPKSQFLLAAVETKPTGGNVYVHHGCVSVDNMSLPLRTFLPFTRVFLSQLARTKT